jgi:hypothetical protein
MNNQSLPVNLYYDLLTVVENAEQKAAAMLAPLQTVFNHLLAALADNTVIMQVVEAKPKGPTLIRPPDTVEGKAVITTSPYPFS